jgi:hypothetical protein
MQKFTHMRFPDLWTLFKLRACLCVYARINLRIKCTQVTASILPNTTNKQSLQYIYVALNGWVMAGIWRRR